MTIQAIPTQVTPYPMQTGIQVDQVTTAEPHVVGYGPGVVRVDLSGFIPDLIRTLVSMAGQDPNDPEVPRIAAELSAAGAGFVDLPLTVAVEHAEMLLVAAEGAGL